MRKTGILFRFIDLGLVLLLAFLAVADIVAETQVQLPGGEASETGQAVLYRLRFDQAMHAELDRLPEGAVYCTADELTTLRACLRAAGRRSSGETGQEARFVLSPEGEAVVQQLVILLDLCEEEGLACTVAS
ncbi:MAG: biopolymer transporter ExbD [Rhodothermales bacterium]